jgi:hypothetical protein
MLLEAGLPFLVSAKVPLRALNQRILLSVSYVLSFELIYPFSLQILKHGERFRL